MIYKREKTEVIKIKDLFFKLGIENKENAICDIKFPLKVKTPYGFKKIVTAFRTEKQTSVTSYFKNNKTLKTSKNHLLKVNGNWKKVKDITKNDIIETKTGTTSIIRKHIGKEEIFYDISVEDVNCYYSNNILSHNSWILTKMGVEAMKQGKNVCHFTLELNENYVGLRYDACFTGIEFQDIRKNIEIVKKKIEPIKGKLFIKYFPIKTVSAQNLKMHIERIQMITGNKIDYVVVDYADLLKPINADKNSNSYTEAGNVYEELRTMAGESQIPIISASQANRGSAHADTVQGHDVADSYRKVMIGDFVFSLSRKPDDKMSNTARIHIIKNRFGPDGKTLPTFFNASNGDIKIYEENSPQGIELKQKMNDHEDRTKDVMREHWNKIKKDRNFSEDE